MGTTPSLTLTGQSPSRHSALALTCEGRSPSTLVPRSRAWARGRRRGALARESFWERLMWPGERMPWVSWGSISQLREDLRRDRVLSRAAEGCRKHEDVWLPMRLAVAR